MMKNKYFIGKDYRTLKEKNDTLESYDELYKNKLDFLNELYDNQNTLKRLWSTYIRHIHQHELLLGKDAMFFDENEVDEVIASKFTYSSSTKQGMLFFIKTYKTWGMDRGDIQGNSAETLNKKNTTKTSKKILENKLWGLGEFYNLLVEIEKKSTFIGGIAFLLVRYGIAGKQLIYTRNVRWEDIDYEKKQVHIINENEKLVRIVDVDNRFLEWIDKYKNEKYPAGISSGRIIEKSKHSRNGDIIENYNTMNNRTFKIAKDLMIPRISFGDVFKSRYMDMLLEIRATRRLTTDDFEWVLMNFSDKSANMTIYNLREMYETIAKEDVIMKNNLSQPTKSLKDTNAKEFVEKLRKEMGYEEFINGEENFDNKDIELNISKEVSADLDKIEN